MIDKRNICIYLFIRWFLDFDYIRLRAFIDTAAVQHISVINIRANRSNRAGHK